MIIIYVPNMRGAHRRNRIVHKYFIALVFVLLSGSNLRETASLLYRMEAYKYLPERAMLCELYDDVEGTRGCASTQQPDHVEVGHVFHQLVLWQ